MLLKTALFDVIENKFKCNLRPMLLHIFVAVTVTQSQQKLVVNVNSAECWAVLPGTGCFSQDAPAATCSVFQTGFFGGDDAGKVEVLCLGNSNRKGDGLMDWQLGEK